MTVGALLDLGADRAELERVLDSMKVDGYHLHFGRKSTCGLDAYDFDVHLETDEHEHDHEHNHDHDHNHAHTRIHRNLYDIYTIIDRMDTNDRVKSLARNMFLIVAEAESKAHGLPVEQVHFHEVGAIDSIIDIVSTAVCVDNLGVEEIVVSPLAEGYGHVHCQHGIIPVPVPATANIAATHGLELRFTDNEGEMVTPTGAAIAAALRTRDRLPSGCRVLKIGMGAGNKEFRQANVMRAMLLEETKEQKREQNEAQSDVSGLWVMEANMDDCTGEMLGFVMECLLEAGAADVWYQPIYMKKNRPAYTMSVLCHETDREKLEDIIFTQTTTIGIRRWQVQRTVLERRNLAVETQYGLVDVKVCTHKGRQYTYPEYESVKSICQKQNMDFQTVYCEAKNMADKNIAKQ